MDLIEYDSVAVPERKKIKLTDCTRLNDEEADSNDQQHDLCNVGTLLPLGNGLNIMHDLEFNGRLPSVTKRYLTPYYRIDVELPGDDICILIHSNRLCMITLAPSHTIFQQNKTIEKVNFQVSSKLDRSLNSVSGKGKHGAQPIQTNSNICFISCTDGYKYTVKGCMVGKLLEVNSYLSECPNLLKESPHKGGYLVIVSPNLNVFEDWKNSLLTEESYETTIKERTSVIEV